MKRFKLVIAGVMALSLIGCDSPLGGDKKDSPVEVKIVPNDSPIEQSDSEVKAVASEHKVNSMELTTRINGKTKSEINFLKNSKFGFFGDSQAEFFGNKKLIYSAMLATKNGVVENTGTISIDGDKYYTFVGMTADGDKSKAKNRGFIKVLKNSNGIGMVASNKGYALNDINGTIDLTEAHEGFIGMYAVGTESKVENKGTLALRDGKFGIGMAASDGGEAVNSSEGTIDLIGTGSDIGMYARGKNSVVKNRGLVELGNNSKGMIAEERGTFAENDGEIRIGDNSEGVIAAGSGATAENKGNIKLGNNSKGMVALNGGYVKNNSNEIIDLTNVEKSIGMLAQGKRAIAENKGAINLGNNSIGMAASAGGKVINNSKEIFDLTRVHDSIGILAAGEHSIGENKGNMKLGAYSTGMVASDSGRVVNTVDRTIDLTDTHDSTGMSSKGNRSFAENKGNIKLGNKSTGMEALDGGHAINDLERKIELANTYDSIGMKAQGYNTIIENKGVIILKGNHGDISGISEINNGELGHDSNHNIGMKIEDNATIKNSGKIIFQN